MKVPRRSKRISTRKAAGPYQARLSSTQDLSTSKNGGAEALKPGKARNTSNSVRSAPHRYSFRPRHRSVIKQATQSHEVADSNSESESENDVNGYQEPYSEEKEDSDVENPDQGLHLDELVSKIRPQSRDEQTQQNHNEDQEPKDASTTSITTSSNSNIAHPIPSRQDCIVCGEETEPVDLVRLRDCDHEPEICGRCCARWIASELKDQVWHEITCPCSGCNAMLQHYEVQTYADLADYIRYDTLAMRTVLNGDPEFFWCRAPGCDSGQIHENGMEENIFHCHACGFKVCVIHEDTWHEGETCEQFDQRIQKKQEDDRKSRQAIKRDSKECPGHPGKPCGWYIFKTDGCDHMTCSRCSHQFCYSCLASWSAIQKHGNTEHREYCRYHTYRLA